MLYVHLDLTPKTVYPCCPLCAFYLYETLLWRLSMILGRAWVGLTYSWEW
jgi:hypothetical protein